MSRSQFLRSLTIVFILTVLAFPTAAQNSGPAVTVNNQVSIGRVVVAEVVSDGPGWIVIRNDGGGRGTPGPVLGFAPVSDGTNTDVPVDLNLDLATAQLFAELHTDDTTEGLFEFQDVAGADAQVEVDGTPVRQLFTAQIIQMDDQPVAEDNTVNARFVVTDAPGWLVIHSEAEGKPGPVLGFAPLRAGLNKNVSVELATDGRTEVVWPMLHVDTGAQGEYEFGTVEGADSPVAVDGSVATFSIWTVPHVRMTDQTPAAGAEGGASTVTAASVLSEGPGWLVIHADAEGKPGPVLGFAPVTAGTNTAVTVTLDQGEATPVVWPMLHVDTGTEGEYEFGTVEGADGPAMDAAGNVITFPISTTGEALPADFGSQTATTSGSDQQTNAATGACSVSPISQDVNRRASASTDAPVVGSLTQGATAEVVGQATGATGAKWWSLADGSWVRADVVAATGACDGVPTVEVPAFTPVPETTQEPGSGT